MHCADIVSLLDSATDADKALVKKAYEFAEKAHAGQLRKSGDPYFTHVYETAKILAELKMDAAAVAAGLLHDTVEDGLMSEETIRKEFGDEILFLIRGVTKLGKVKYRGGERYIENLRKFVVAAAEDIRVLVIKIADRLHNMRTLGALREDKRERIALETLEIYAPLADRLSIRLVAREMEDLAFKYLHPAEYEAAVKIVKAKTKETMPRLEKFAQSVKKALAENGLTSFKMDYRQKGVYSLYKKLAAHEGDIEKIYDILAIRIRVDTVAECYQALGIIHGIWRPMPGRIKDYIASPKANGYRSLHTTVFTGDGSVVEIQIRTNEMHYDSEYGRASHAVYKKQGSKGVSSHSEAKWFARFLPEIINYSAEVSPRAETATPKWIRDLAATQQEAATDLEKREIVRDMKADFFHERIFVLTPKGDVIDLPKGATPIDFAYAIHSSVGEHVSGARVNGRMIGIDTELHNSDIVEIITKPSSKPSVKWLDIAKTTMARRHINNWLEKNRKK
ncbi:MAG: bifunctional (p)ppGpp synthetase/guanosine-3',5'-bis(diphosphate) 3'-pyrophosphohydrolase [Patescibacteria group bacterium]|nr:HD domain-containing protein [Patescibacteria group bacterium]MDE1946035.1 bifunctional (p)ppGpp synthetase/guanosine-3',5'-bis(diphosphate) 3'-pyrophosphohydrolase [Patescibacteria group bacterium]